MANLLYLNQFITTTLSVIGGIDASQTTSIVIQSDTGLDTTKPGIACVSYADPLDMDDAEFIEYSSINSTTNTLQGVVRGAEGYAAKTHSNGVTVAFPVSESHINRLADALSIDGVSTNGVTKTTTTVAGASSLDTETVVASYVGKSTSTTSSTTPTPTGDRKHNELYVTALAAAAELQAPSGTATNGNKLVVRIKDDGTARALTYNAIYRGVAATLPATTTISKTLYMGFLYNSADTKWDLVATIEES